MLARVKNFLGGIIIFFENITRVKSKDGRDGRVGRRNIGFNFNLMQERTGLGLGI